MPEPDKLRPSIIILLILIVITIIIFPLALVIQSYTGAFTWSHLPLYCLVVMPFFLAIILILNLVLHKPDRINQRERKFKTYIRILSIIGIFIFVFFVIYYGPNFIPRVDSYEICNLGVDFRCDKEHMHASSANQTLTMRITFQGQKSLITFVEGSAVAFDNQICSFKSIKGIGNVCPTGLLPCSIKKDQSVDMTFDCAKLPLIKDDRIIGEINVSYLTEENKAKTQLGDLVVSVE